MPGCEVGNVASCIIRGQLEEDGAVCQTLNILNTVHKEQHCNTDTLCTIQSKSINARLTYGVRFAVAYILSEYT